MAEPLAPTRGRPARGAHPDGRQRLLRAARVEFGERGYGATTIEHLTKAAGLNAPTVYHHFGGRAGLFQAAARDAYSEVLHAFREALPDGTSFDEAVDALLDVSLKIINTDLQLSKLFLVIQFELPRNPDLAAELHPTMREFRAVFDSVAARAPKHLAATETDHRNLSRALIALINGLNGEALLLPRRVDYRQLVERMRALLNRQN